MLHAQTLESVLSPGLVIKAHAKTENECNACHVRFDRVGQDAQCQICHKNVGQDLRQHRGLHGLQKPQSCRTCHTDHRGREARIVNIDKHTFDHALTDYALRGAHTKVDCEKCHLPAKKYRDAPTDCNACHRKDDVHKTSLGPKCADCHAVTSWKEAKFDHEKTHFPLVGKHVDTKCVDCHKDKVYKDTPRNCYACHKKDDDQKGHKSLFGEKCDSCHNTKLWKTIVFNHDLDTKYALRGKHRAVRCNDCHTGHLYKVKLSQTCNDCHRKDDKHKETLGKDCAACHAERDWKEKVRFDHAKTHFPLEGKHVDTACKDCHKSLVFKEAPSTCIACHRKDDKHKGSLGDACQQCHGERNWKQTRFDHAKTRFVLLGKHVKTECNACHKSINYKEAPKDCYSCHLKQDKHEGQEGRNCEQCHVESDWKTVPRFDHGLVRFPLLGKHAKVECKDCHKTARFKDAQRACLACHLKDDKHKKTLGVACEPCHNARTWKAWDFDHDKRSQYALDGKHKDVACAACHTKPMAGKVTAETRCYSCHAKNDVHDGSYGRRCEQCHVTTSFKTIRSRIGTSSSALDVWRFGPPSGPDAIWPNTFSLTGGWSASTPGGKT